MCPKVQRSRRNFVAFSSRFCQDSSRAFFFFLKINGFQSGRNQRSSFGMFRQTRRWRVRRTIDVFFLFHRNRFVFFSRRKTKVSANVSKKVKITTTNILFDFFFSCGKNDRIDSFTRRNERRWISSTNDFIDVRIIFTLFEYFGKSNSSCWFVEKQKNENFSNKLSKRTWRNSSFVHQFSSIGSSTILARKRTFRRSTDRKVRRIVPRRTIRSCCDSQCGSSVH